MVLLFVGVYYLFLFIIALGTKDLQHEKYDNYFYFLIIPAKNEEKVIEKTINACLKFKSDNYRIIVVDDGSEDLTPAIVNAIAKINQKVILLNNTHESKQKGKGAVLNYAFRQIKLAIEYGFTEPFNLSTDLLSNFDKEHIIIGVFDADAQPSSNILEEVSRIFSNLNVDAVQTAVRISNRDQSLIAKMQDIEFLGFSRIIQKARSNFGSVGLGGNGQFSKLSSLEKIGNYPWGDTLTEDFELGLRMISKGMRLYFTDKAIVEQEGVITLRSLFKQRTRWLQGHFTNWKYIPSIIKSSSSIITKVDTLIYILFVSVVFLVGLSLTLSLMSILKLIIVKNNLLEPLYNKHYLLGLIALFAYSFAFIPMFVYSVFKFYKENHLFSKIAYILLFALYTYIWLPAGIAGLYRIVTRRNEWVKTSRVINYLPTFSYIKEDAFQYIIERRRSPRFIFHAFTLVEGSGLCFVENLSEHGAKLVFPTMKKPSQDMLTVNLPIYGEKKVRIAWQKTSQTKLETGVEFVN